MRDPAATFFTLVLPVVFLVLFVTIFGNQTLDSGVESNGIAITRMIATEAAGPAVANAISLPLFFISGIFVPAEDIPD
ncbi:MAG: hypothetical protein M3507_08805 [Actinomycetota bacterium]|nr:hypothetical protein [Actinomycetota bacterium]